MLKSQKHFHKSLTKKDCCICSATQLIPKAVLLLFKAEQLIYVCKDGNLILTDGN